MREPVLLDVTRLIELRWTGRQPNGIDRVCLAYLEHFASRARAVVQHRGVIRGLGETASRRLFEQLANGGARIRSTIAAHLAGALAAPARPAPGSLYLNVTHTDFDLTAHAKWVRRHALRAAYLIHDLIPILHPEHCRAHAVARHAGRVRAAVRHGSGIIVGSAAVARDLASYVDGHGLTAPPIVVAPLAGAPIQRTPSTPASICDYFLCVGTIESRKNHALLLDVWRRLHVRLGAAAPKLIIVGRWGSGSAAFREALAASGLAGRLIEILDDCDDDTLATLMNGARAMLMPSLAEGFGLPMAEALSIGVPVIASDLPSFREIGRGVPVLLDPFDVDAWEARIAALDRTGAHRQRWIDALHDYTPTRWTEHFACVDAWLAGVASAPARHSIQATHAALPARVPHNISTEA